MIESKENQCIRIITNNHWRPFLYYYEVPKKILNSDFDWMENIEDNYTDGFINYKGNWYHISDFMKTSNSFFPSNWQGYHSDSFFSGILIEISEDGECYKIATYIS